MNFTINPETNRPVRIGGPTYNKLILKYYISLYELEFELFS